MFVCSILILYIYSCISFMIVILSHHHIHKIYICCIFKQLFYISCLLCVYVITSCVSDFSCLFCHFSAVKIIFYAFLFSFIIFLFKSCVLYTHNIKIYRKIWDVLPIFDGFLMLMLFYLSNLINALL